MKIRVCNKVYDHVVNREFQYVYFLKSDVRIEDLKIQEEEVQAIKFVPLKQVDVEVRTTTGRYPERHIEYWIDMLDEIDKRVRFR